MPSGHRRRPTRHAFCGQFRRPGRLVKTGASTTFQLSGSNSVTGGTTGCEITSPLFTAGTFDLVTGDVLSVVATGPAYGCRSMWRRKRA